jgi:hypothetical protein
MPKTAQRTTVKITVTIASCQLKTYLEINKSSIECPLYAEPLVGGSNTNIGHVKVSAALAKKVVS